MVTSFLKKIESHFNKDGLTIDVNDDLNNLEKILNNTKDYPYKFDPEFSKKINLRKGDYFVLFLKDKNGAVVSTYSAKVIDVDEWIEERMKPWIGEKNGKILFNNWSTLNQNAVYSSCQWVRSDYRGRGIGYQLDYYKKAYSLNLFNWSHQFCHCKEDLREYHLKYLRYTQFEKAFCVPGGLPGSGNDADLYYYLLWITKEEMNDFLKSV